MAAIGGEGEEVVGVSKAVSACDVTITFASTPDNYYVVINGGVGPQGAQGAAGAAGAAGRAFLPGATGQVLAKVNGTDYNTQWIDQSGGAGTVAVANGGTGTALPARSPAWCAGAAQQ